MGRSARTKRPWYVESLQTGRGVCNAQALGLNKEEILATADGVLHEIGKLEIPQTILRKPTKLTPEEMLIMDLSEARGIVLFWVVREVHRG